MEIAELFYANCPQNPWFFYKVLRLIFHMQKPQNHANILSFSSLLNLCYVMSIAEENLILVIFYIFSLFYIEKLCVVLCRRECLHFLFKVECSFVHKQSKRSTKRIFIGLYVAYWTYNW